MEVDRNGLQVLDRQECLALLRRGGIGRVGVTSGALPVVLPVDFALVADEILIHTTPGTQLDAATRDAVVAFEADEIDPHERTGWSVVVTGKAHEVPGDVELPPRAVAGHWAPDARGRYVAITTDVISGRRCPPALRRDIAAT